MWVKHAVRLVHIWSHCSIDSCGLAEGTVLFTLLPMQASVIEKISYLGLGCDGASVDCGARGIKGYFEKSVLWVLFFWCLANSLELALQDTLKDTLLSSIDEMLLHLYFLYEIPPIYVYHEFVRVVDSLSQCLEPTESPDEERNRPIRASSTRLACNQLGILYRPIWCFTLHTS